MTWEGSDSLRPYLVAADGLRPHPRNPRRGKVTEIMKSLERFGQTRPILTNAAGTVVAGNHTMLAARELGWTHVAAVTEEFATETEELAYLLADNRTSDLGDYDQEELRNLLRAEHETGRLEGTGYTEDDLHDLWEESDRQAADALEEVEGTIGPGTPIVVRQIVLTIDDGEQYRTTINRLRVLTKEYGAGGMSEAVLNALERQAAL